MRGAFILLVLTAAAFAVGEFLFSEGRRHTGYFYYNAGLVLSAVTILLAITNVFRRKPKRKQLARTQRTDRGEHFNYSPELRKSLARLKSLSDHLPTDDLGEHYVNEYHALLEAVQSEIHHDLSPFRIPQSELRKHFAGLEWEGAHKGWEALETEEQFCPPHVFRIAISGALAFIDDILRQIALNPPLIKQGELESKSDLPKPDPPKLQTTDAPQLPEQQLNPDERLALFLNRLPDDDWIPEHFFTTYHQDPTDIQSETGRDLSRYFIPESALKRRQLSRREPGMGNRRAVEAQHSRERGVDRDVFILAVERAIQALKDDPAEAKAETPAAPDVYEPDRLAAKVLHHIYNDADSDPMEALPKKLNVGPLEIEHRLDKLVEHDYLNFDRFAPLRGESEYSLSAKGRAYLRTPIRKIPFPSGDDTIDKDKENILKLFTRPDCDPREQWIAAATQIHPLRIKVLMSELMTHKYVDIKGFDEWHTPVYELTNRGINFLIRKGHIK